MASTSPAHRVLSMPELLGLIFSFLDNESNTVNMCVCKLWSEICLDLLWHTVDDINRLFSLLGPLRLSHGYSSERSVKFSKLPGAVEWKRFEYYAKRVRRLRFDREARYIFHKGVFAEVAQTRTSLNILPNLRTLEWIATSLSGVDNSIMFMHENVKEFAVFFPVEFLAHPTRSLQSFSQEMVQRMPHLTLLDLRMSIAARYLERDILFLCQNLQSLQKIVLPTYHITPRVVEVLSKLPVLGVIQFEYGSSQGKGEPKDITPFAPALEEGAFPSLWDFSFSASFSDATQFFSTKFFPANLTTLYIGSPRIETPADVQTLLVVVAENCQLLKALIIEVANFSIAYPTDPDSRITMDTLRPILACGNLTTFELTHMRPLALTQDDITTVARGWPAIETLMLNCEPIDLVTPSPLTLAALTPFAAHCPHLMQLGLFFQVTELEFPPPTPFRALRRLCVGASVTPDDGPIAMYLARVCPLGCEVKFGVTWGEFEVEDMDVDEARDDLLEEVAVRCEKWREVARLLPLLTRLRVDELDRMRKLEKEVVDLRTRNEILTDSSRVRKGVTEGSCVVT